MVILIRVETEWEFILIVIKKEEVERLALAINDKFNIYTGVLHDRNNQWILTIGAKILTLLRNIVSEYFHDSMKYRIGL